MARFKARPRSQPEALERPIGLTAADYNGDGHLDLAAVNASDVGILLGKRPGFLHVAFQSFLRIGRSDCRGRPATITETANWTCSCPTVGSSQAFYFPGNGDGTFGTKITYTTGGGFRSVWPPRTLTAMAPWTWPSPTDRPTTFPFFLQLLPVSLNPTSLSFGNQPVSTASASQAVILK